MNILTLFRRAPVDANASEAKKASAWARANGPVDPLLLGVVIALIAFGVVMVFSASAVYASQTFEDGHHFLRRQAAFALMALPLMLGVASIDYHRIRPLTYPILLTSTGLLLYVALGFGHSAGGAARWIPIGPIHVQPAETAKVAVILWLAYSLSKKRDQVRTFKIGVLPHLLVAVILGMLCLRQPDFGSAVMIVLLTFVLLFAAGAKVGPIVTLLSGLGLVGVLLVVTSPYRMSRVTSFLDPFGHRQHEGYQLAEAILAFGSGGVSGVGIGDSRQKLFFLPEAHTDFISAIIGEELGFVGICLVVCAFVVIVLRGMRAAFRAPDDYGSLLAVGLTMFIGLQAFINLGVAMGLLPTKGLVLPFLSYGGSALLVNAAAMGLLLNVSRPREGAEEAAEAERLAARAAAEKKTTRVRPKGSNQKSDSEREPGAKGTRGLAGGAA